MEPQEQTLPRGWVEVELEELVSKNGVFSDGDWVESKDQDPDGDVRLVQLADIGEMAFLDKSARFMTSARAEKMKCMYLQKDDLLISRLGDPLGKASLYPARESKAVTAVDVCVFRPGNEYIEPKLVGYFLNSMTLRRLIDSHASGTTRKRITGKKLKSLPFRLPPLNEQKRIVSKIEELFSDLDEGEAALNKTQKLLATYRQSVLKAAITGELTKDWREANQYRLESGEELLKRILQARREQWQGYGKYQEPQAPDTTNLPELPEGWVWASTEQICDAIVDCPHSTPKWTTEGVICVRTTEFLPGRLKLDEVRYVSGETYRERIARLEPKAGDVLYSREGGILGIACIIPKAISLCMGQRMMLMRASISGEYLMHVLNSPITISLVSQKTGGSASPHLNVRDIKLFPIPFPSEDEQLEIIGRLDVIFSQISALENWCSTELAHSATLRQSILKAAFSGKLVPQDPHDEPAIVLLKRIRAERAAQDTTQLKRGRRNMSNTKEVA